MEKISTQGMRFVDEYGRERIFRGINLIDKKPHLGKKVIFKYPVDDAYLQRCQSLGFNLIRLGALWDVFEPQPGQYNEEFLDELGEILDRCAKYGIYVFLDVHQDVWGEAANKGGSGAPAWATLTDGYKVKNTRFVWSEGYFFRKAVWAAFDNFWGNAPVQGKGLQDWYADLWRHLAARFKDKPALLGYEPMNEPFSGRLGGKTFRRLIASLVKVVLTDKRVKIGKLLHDARKNPNHVLDQINGDVLLDIAAVCAPLTRDFDENRYNPFLNKITSAIREIDPGHTVFVGDSYWSNIGIPCFGGPIAPGGARESNQCFTPHAYDFTVDTPAYEFANNDRVGGIFAEHRRAQERINAPVIVGEWGGGGEGTNWYPHISSLLDLFEKNKWSNTYFFYLEDAEEMAYRNKVEVGKQDLFEIPLASEVLSRPFPMAVGGEIERYHYDETGRTFELVFTQSEVCSAPTEVFLPSAPKEVQVSGGEHEVEPYGGGFCIKWQTVPGVHSLNVRI
ncbi:MAG: cellulase family glycosylhydrolase [Oscillospiraceae bacterium]|nr:cellulase family glycosylhydrolase [Oscillospiraceae bacterium]